MGPDLTKEEVAKLLDFIKKADLVRSVAVSQIQCDRDAVCDTCKVDWAIVDDYDKARKELG